MKQQAKRVQTQGDDRSFFLLFTIDGESYAYPLDRIKGILLRSEVEVIPWEGDEAFVGIVRQGDGMVPIIELRGILGLPGERVRSIRQGIVVVEAFDGRYGLLVDECNGVKSFQVKSLSRFHPSLATGEQAIFSGLLNDGDRIILFFAENALFPGKLREKVRSQLANSDRYLTLAKEVKDLELGLEEKPTVDGFLQLAELYQKQGRKKDSERCLLMAESMERGVEAAEEGRTPILRGTIESGIFVEILQMLSLSRKSGDLCIQIPGESQEAVIHIRQGQIWDAKIGWKVGREAFCEVINRSEGLWEFHDDRQEEVQRRITKNAQFLILDALKKRDESSAEAKGEKGVELVATARREE
jgi:chemotaxis signal transduction protein